MAFLVLHAEIIPENPQPGLTGVTDQPSDTGPVFALDNVMTGPVTAQQPSFYTDNLTGVSLPEYALYWYDRVYWIPPQTNDFGLISGAIEEPMRFFNAFRSDVVLTDIESVGGEQTELTGISEGLTLPAQGEVDATFTIPESAEGFIDGSYTITFNESGALVEVFSYSFSAQKIEVWPSVGDSLEPNWSYSVDERFELMTEIITSDNNSEQRIAKRSYPRHYISATFLITEGLIPTFRLMMIKSDQQFLLPYWIDPYYITFNTSAGATTLTANSPIDNLVVGDYVVFESPSGLTTRQVTGLSGADINLKAPITEDIPSNARIWKGFYGRLNPETRYSQLTGTINEVLLEFDVQNEVGRVLNPPFEVDADEYLGLPVLNVKSDWSRPLDIREFYQSDKLELGPNNREYFYKWDESQRTEQMSFLNFSKEHAYYIRDFFLNRRARQLAFWRPSMIPDMRLAQETTDPSSQSLRVTPGRLSEVYRQGSSLYRNIMIQFTDGGRRYYEIESVTDGAEYAVITLTSQVGRELRYKNVDRICWLYYVRFANDDFTISHETSKVSNVSLAVTTVKNRLGE